MKLSKNLAETISDQICFEQYSAQIYLAMSLDLQEKGLPGMASWYWEQHKEELDHAYEMIHYLQSRGVKPTIKSFDKVKVNFKDALEIFTISLKHEQEVSARIHNIVKITIEESDYGAENFFRKYITEQEEEESKFEDIINSVKVADTNSMIYVDRMLGNSIKK